MPTPISTNNPTFLDFVMNAIPTLEDGDKLPTVLVKFTASMNDALAASGGKWGKPVLVVMPQNPPIYGDFAPPSYAMIWNQGFTYLAVVTGSG